jgi:RNA polymerase sigma-70 factor (ECF subfamily)
MLATMYRVAEGTVRRWLADSRHRIVDETRRRLAERLDISPADCQSLVALLQSQVDLSVLKILKEQDKD